MMIQPMMIQPMMLAVMMLSVMMLSDRAFGRRTGVAGDAPGLP